MDLMGEVGPQAVAAGDGTPSLLRMGRTGDGIFTQLHGRYFEQGARGRIFTAANQAAQAVSAALATTYTGLLVYNPVGSGVALVPLRWKYAMSLAPAASASIGLIGGWAAGGGVTAFTTPLTVRSSQIGNSSVGKGQALSAATIVTPFWYDEFFDGFTAASAPNPTPPVDHMGIFQILPGGFLAIGALTAITGLGAVQWEEVDLVNPAGGSI